MLLRIAAFIKQHKLEGKSEKDIPWTAEFGFTMWEFISSIYEAGWNILPAKNDHKSFRQCISTQFNNNKSSNSTKNQSQKTAPKGKQANISKVSSPISSHPSKKILEKYKFFMKNLASSLTRNPLKKPLYAQTSKGDLDEIIRIKKAFPKLLANKVSEIYKMLNHMNQNKKPKLNITIKGLSRKQVIVSMSTNNILRMMAKANTHVSNIN